MLLPEDNLIGRQLDEYRLEALLGRGGMARVYRALDVRLKRYAAVKVIDTPFRSDDEYLRRFELEAQAIAQLDHPAIVRIYRYGEADGLLYMAMQYVEGSDLQALLHSYETNNEFMPLSDIARLIRQVCLALDYAHSKGVIHRDIKPSNIMLDKAGRAILADFGLVLLADAGTRGEIFGTPQYIAPEQAISSAGAVPQSDFYAIGVILYRMLTGRLPFDSSDLLEMAMMHMTEPPPPPHTIRSELTPALEAVVLKALAKEPAARFANGKALADALDTAVQEAAASAQTTRDPSLSVVERVALDMRALPPLPAGLTPPRAQREKAGAETEGERGTPSRPDDPLPVPVTTTPITGPLPKPVTGGSAPFRQAPTTALPLPAIAAAIGGLILIALCLLVILLWVSSQI